MSDKRAVLMSDKKVPIEYTIEQIQLVDALERGSLDGTYFFEGLAIPTEEFLVAGCCIKAFSQEVFPSTFVAGVTCVEMLKDVKRNLQFAWGNYE